MYSLTGQQGCGRMKEASDEQPAFRSFSLPVSELNSVFRSSNAVGLVLRQDRRDTQSFLCFSDKEKYCFPLFTDLLSKQYSALLLGCFHDSPLVKVIGVIEFYTETSSSPVSVGAHFTTAFDAPPGPGGNLAL